LEAERNIMADKLANEGMKYPQMEHFSLPHCKSEIYLSGLLITKNHKQVLKDAHQSIDMRDYYQEKYVWSHTITENIWWMVHGKAFPSFNASIQNTLIKYIHGRFPCNHRENIYYQYRSPLCTTCATQTETQEHIIRCNGNDHRIMIKKNFVRNLYRIMEANETDERMSRVIGMCVNHWINGDGIPKIKDLADEPPKHLLVEAYKEQTKIGWDQFLKGRLTI
jgi:DNA-directed RNA polymerase subunit RPC12/RpoP